MASKKGLSGDVVVGLLEQMVESQDLLRRELSGKIDGLSQRLDGTNERLDRTNDRLDRLERAVVGVGRASALEARVQRLEEHVGIEPPR